MFSKIILVLLVLVAISMSRKELCSPCQFAGDGVIFCDDFESQNPLKSRYFGYDDDDGEFIRMEGAGRNGSAGMRVKWQKGEVEAGVLQKAIGKNADPGMVHAASPDSSFNEIYWRIDIKHEDGWEGGGGDKLTRATSIVSKTWQQSMIAHLWSGGKGETRNYLVIDPASGLSEAGELQTTRYNDFPNLRWLGGAMGLNPIFSEKNSGKWYCITAHLKLNTPGLADGIFEYWIDGTLQAKRSNLNWHAAWNTYGINAVFFENYWNDGSVKEQERHFDNIIISTQPIACNCN